MPSSPASDPPALLKRRPDAELMQDDTGRVFVFVDDEALALDGVSPQLARELFDHADGSLSHADIVDRLAERYPAALLRQALAALEQAGLLQAIEPGRFARCPVALIGNGPLLDALGDAFEREGFGRCERMQLAGEATTDSERFRAVQRARRLTASGDLEPVAPTGAARSLSDVTPETLKALLPRFELVVCALEGVARQVPLLINQAALETFTPCVFVTACERGASVGPTVVGGSSACLACRWWSAAADDAVHELVPFARTPAFAGPHPLAAWAARACVDEARSVLDPSAMPRLATSVLRLQADGRRRALSLPPRGGCPGCAARDPDADPSPRRAFASAAAATVEISGRWPESPQASTRPRPDGYRTVGIIGGGTAGYLAALALRAKRPELEVTLIESSAIPIIGVGEATTPELVKFLHSPRFLGRDIVDFFERVRPTFKLGIMFEWGPPGQRFTFPFQRGRMLESQLYAGDINSQSLGSLLMMSKRAPLFRRPDGDPLPLMHAVRWAYHLDNQRLVRYLQDEAAQAGVKHIDAKIEHARVSSDGQRIDELVADDGRRFSFDLYVDCSGFRSLLLGGALGSPFVSYASSLLTDRAVVAHVPHDGTVKPYTLAETMPNGWCWNIPFEPNDHRGYVFSSSFVSDDEAVAEMRARNPGMDEPRIVRFASGRREHFWRGNVVAIGNSYAFVEPLESTALHMIVLELELLTSHFPESRNDTAVQAVLNRKLATRWDALRWFLSIHYRFNRRLDTPFWRAANHDLDSSGADDKVALFRERAPLSYRSSLFYTVLPPEFFSDDHAYDTLLLGQRVDAQLLAPVEDEATWTRSVAALGRLGRSALPQAEALGWLREHGASQLRDFQQRPDSWLHTWLPA